MVIKHKIGVLAIVPVAALLVLSLISWRTLNRTSLQFDKVVNQDFASLIDEEINPLINDTMLPLINEDIPDLQQMQESIVLLLEADRDVHQSLIAEKMAIYADDPEALKKAEATHAENIQQAAGRMQKASQQFHSEKAKGLYSAFLADFQRWQEVSRTVLKHAADADKLAQARQTSNGGIASEAFDTMRDKIDQLQESIYEEIAVILGAVEEKKETANAKEGRVNAKKEETVQTARQTQSGIQRAIFIFITVAAAAGVAVAVLALGISRSILLPLKKICLLYTSPSPRDRTRYRMPSSA